MPIRTAKIAMVAAIALFASIVTFGNLTDYHTNYLFVQHVLSMDTILPFSDIRYRAIADPALHRVAYATIIATEGAIAVLCWIGAFQLARHVRADAAIQPGQGHRGDRPHARLSALAGRLHDGRRRVVRHVAVAAMERRAERIPLRHGDCSGADLPGTAGLVTSRSQGRFHAVVSAVVVITARRFRSSARSRGTPWPPRTSAEVSNIALS